MHARRVRRFETRIRFAGRDAAAADPRHMQIQRPGVREDRPRRGDRLLQLPLDLAERRAEVELHFAASAIELVEGGAGAEQFGSDVIAAEPLAVPVHLEQPIEGVHRPERLHVLFVGQRRSGPDRRHRQPGPAIPRERILQHEILGCELGDARREGGAGVVGPEIVRTQAVDDKQEDEWLRLDRRGRQRRNEVDRNWTDDHVGKSGIRAQVAIERWTRGRRAQHGIRDPK